MKRSHLFTACAILAATILAGSPAAVAAPPPPPADGGLPAGSWSAGKVVEPESVEEVPAAVTSSRSGFTVAVAREPGGQRVLGILRLPPADQDFLDDARSVQLQIDDGVRVEPPRIGGGLKSSTFLLWDGVGEPVLGPLRDLMEARGRVRVQYPLAGGGYKVVDFGAGGVKEAIAAVLGVAREVTPEARDLAKARQDAVETCLSEGKTKDRDRCLERLAGCRDAGTPDALRTCIAAARK
jgi:hypothetical protein